jgi:hypothetical protein
LPALIHKSGHDFGNSFFNRTTNSRDCFYKSKRHVPHWSR